MRVQAEIIEGELPSWVVGVVGGVYILIPEYYFSTFIRLDRYDYHFSG